MLFCQNYKYAGPFANLGDIPFPGFHRPGFDKGRGQGNVSGNTNLGVAAAGGKDVCQKSIVAVRSLYENLALAQL